MLEEFQPDVLLLDIIMPHLDGLGVLEVMYSDDRLAKTQVIMLTAFGQEDVMKQAVTYGASYFMLKPFELISLYKKYYTVLDKNRECKKTKHSSTGWTS